MPTTSGPRAVAKRRGPGRPTLGDKARSRLVALKLTEAEYKLWRALAGDKPLSEWIRQRCAP